MAHANREKVVHTIDGWERKMNEVVLVTGPPGSGKSTIARGVAEHFPMSAHLKVDDLREMMVNGFEPPGVWTDETERQFVRARRSAVSLARAYAADGVTFVVDDVCVPEHFQDHYADLLRDPGVRRIMLKPTIEALMGRLEARNGPWDSVQEVAPNGLGTHDCVPSCVRVGTQAARHKSQTWAGVRRTLRSRDSTSEAHDPGEQHAREVS